jgi:tetratricopeptide (TPR) repeat protein/predicted Ser/Thr protein kinase
MGGANLGLPRLLGRFELQELLGSGGMGLVYRARDTKLGRAVAVKVLSEDLFRDEGARHRFLREARLTATLNHPNVATLYEADEEDGVAFMVMELVEGTNLRELVHRSGGLPLRQILQIGAGVCAALGEAHGSGIVHRDVKSSNIMVTPQGGVKVLDFGLAKVISRAVDDPTLARETARAMPSAPRPVEPDDLTLHGVVVGTVHYMSPEQTLGAAIDGRSDIFSLGVVLYEAASGELPFKGQTEDEVRRAIQNKTPPALHHAERRIPRALARIVDKCLAKKPEDRIPTAERLRQELLQLETRLLRRRLAMVAALVAGLVSIGVAIATHRGSGSPPAPGAPRILVADFDNRTGDPFFDHTVRELLTLALEQSRFVSIFPQSAAGETLKRMHLAAGTELDRPLAREVSRRENLGVFLAGTILPASEGLRIVVEAIDPGSDATLAVVESSFQGREQLWQSVDRLAAALRGRLGEEARWIAEHSRSLQPVTTSSLEALGLFSEALVVYADGDLEQAQSLLVAAVASDPDFAVAQARLFVVENARGRPEEGLAALERAFRLRDRVTEPERYLIDVSYYTLTKDYDRALQIARAWTAAYPDDPDGYRFLANTAEWVGYLPEALDAARRSADLLPTSLMNRGLLALLLAEANRNDEALREVELARANGLDGAYLHWGEGLAWLGKDDAVRATESFRRLESGDPIGATWAGFYLAQTHVLEGRLEEASEELDEARAGQEVAPGATILVSLERYALALLQERIGDDGEAHELAEALAASAAHPWDLGSLRQAAILEIELGRPSHAESTLQGMTRLAERYPGRFARGMVAHVGGELWRAKGRTPEAGQRLEEAVRLWPDIPALWSLARFRMEGGNAAEALPLYQEILSRRGEILRREPALFWELAQFEIARCLQALGRDREAARRYEEFLRVWKGSGDQDLVREAESRRRALRLDR